MADLYLAGATATVAAGSKSVAVSGFNLSTVKSGMTLYLGSANGRSGTGYRIVDVDAAFATSGTLTTAGAIPVAFNAVPFVVDSGTYNGTISSLVLNQVASIINAFLELTGAVPAVAGDREITLNKADYARLSQIVFAIAGQEQFALRQRNLAGKETLCLSYDPDGMGLLDAIQIDRATGQVTIANLLGGGGGGGGGGDTGALTIRVSNLEGQTADLYGKLDAERTARISAIQALSSRIDTSGASLDGVRAQITAEASARSAADDALDGRLDPIELIMRIFAPLKGDEATARPVGPDAGYGLMVRDEAFDFFGGFASDAVVAPALRLPDGSRLGTVTADTGYLLPIRDRGGREFGGFAADGVVARALRLLSGGGLGNLQPETGLGIEFGNRALVRSGVANDGGLEVPRIEIAKSRTALRDAGAEMVSIRDATGRVAPLLDYEGRLAGELPRQLLVERLVSGAMMPVHPSRNIACWGTSQTQGQQPSVPAWPEHLQSLFTAAQDWRRLVNCGAGGQNSSQIVGRMGGKPVVVSLAGNAITYGQDVAVTAMEPRILTPGWDKVARTTLAGVRGLFYRNGSIDAQGTDAIFFHPDPVGLTGTVPCPAGTPFTVATRAYRGWTAIFDLGQNIPNKDRATWRADALAAVRSLLVTEPRCLFMGASLFADSLPPGAGPTTGRTPQYPGTPDYQAFLDLHAEMRRLAGDRFVDVHQYLVDYGMADAIALGLLTTVTDGDRADIANNFVPRSLRWDELHFNTIAHRLIAMLFFNILLLKGW